VHEETVHEETVHEETVHEEQYLNMLIDYLSTLESLLIHHRTSQIEDTIAKVINEINNRTVDKKEDQ